MREAAQASDHTLIQENQWARSEHSWPHIGSCVIRVPLPAALTSQLSILSQRLAVQRVPAARVLTFFFLRKSVMAPSKAAAAPPATPAAALISCLLRSAARVHSPGLGQGASWKQGLHFLPARHPVNQVDVGWSHVLLLPKPADPRLREGTFSLPEPACCTHPLTLPPTSSLPPCQCAPPHQPPPSAPLPIPPSPTPSPPPHTHSTHLPLPPLQPL